MLLSDSTVFLYQKLNFRKSNLCQYDFVDRLINERNSGKYWIFTHTELYGFLCASIIIRNTDLQKSNVLVFALPILPNLTIHLVERSHWTPWKQKSWKNYLLFSFLFWPIKFSFLLGYILWVHSSYYANQYVAPKNTIICQLLRFPFYIPV